jgi:hypothetical protein
MSPAVSAVFRAAASGFGNRQLFIDNHFLGQVDKLSEFGEELVEVGLGSAEIHEEQYCRHDVGHLENIDSCAFGIRDTRLAAILQEPLKGHTPLMQLRPVSDTVALDGRG